MFKWTFTLTLTAGFLALSADLWLAPRPASAGGNSCRGLDGGNSGERSRRGSRGLPGPRSPNAGTAGPAGRCVGARQTAYAQQLAELDARRTALVAGLEQAEGQAAEVAQQVATVQAARTERLGVYQAQLQQAQAEYDARYGAMAQQLAEAEAKLAEANAILGR